MFSFKTMTQVAYLIPTHICLSKIRCATTKSLGNMVSETMSHIVFHTTNTGEFH